mmetsp:Transcript_11887/g.17936  ORF Transcript_11887/g.17936 Transcript_11887/m.17936 type:complete len:695 (+) Transcript_11887:76-2160(+)|eukprot:CAMPEP_0202687904 /NCGR_PEP_ID=MMETSP1385-20130828/3463_1 /ASSEMBLY_ACC=CAM_ASM_000861 /TAXON_ID=933848 /ORGANISM="Elphidium margaritaceum" /LENGTH=694 /DNA_ID=CAMNT_0049342757 /DNA_START=57 /DNA_END=2141 /DNA_ORIENTATION=-
MHLLWLLSCFVFSVYGDNHADGEDTVGYGGMVASSHFLASQAGRRVLLAGGNAAEAALAVQLVLNVVQPTSTGIGGGCFIVYYDSAQDEVYAIDGREEAPDAYNPYVFCSDTTCYESNGADSACNNCDTIPFGERRTGGLGVGVPGTLSAFYRLWTDFGGTTAWSDLFTDAIDVATNGFIMYEDLYDYVVANSAGLGRFESTCKAILNYPDCDTPKYEVGDTVIWPDFANTLTLLAANATEAIRLFYRGDIAEAIVNQTRGAAINSVTGRAGVMEIDDMIGYQAVYRDPISSELTFGGETYEAYGMNMPSSGPLTVQYQLKMLEALLNDEVFATNGFDVSSLDSDTGHWYDPRALHYFFSAQNIAFADRNQYMADNDFVNVPVAGIQQDSYLSQRAEDYLTKMAQSLPIPYGEPDGWDDMSQSSTNESGTAHITVVDQWGNVASVTTTIESVFGSYYVLDGYGFFLNNELTDFSSVGVVGNVTVANGPEGGKKLRSSALDLFGHQDSTTYGGKRPRSSMSPMIVLQDGSPYIAAGGVGGSSIIGTVFNVIARMLIYGIGPQASVNAARVWGFNSGALVFDQTRWEETMPNITNELVNKLGYSSLYPVSFGRSNAIQISTDGLLYCGADTTRWSVYECAAVCNGTTSACPFSMTTAFPESTNPTITATGDSVDGDGAAVITVLYALMATVIGLFA